MDKVLGVVEGVGEYGIDTEASPGNGRYYVKLYDGSYDIVGYSKKEAIEVLDMFSNIAKRKALNIPFNKPMPGEYDNLIKSFRR
jgi:hypothetical protein